MVTVVVLVDDTFGPVTVNLNTYSPVVDGAVNVAFSLSASEMTVSIHLPDRKFAPISK